MAVSCSGFDDENGAEYGGAAVAAPVRPAADQRRQPRHPATTSPVRRVEGRVSAALPLGGRGGLVVVVGNCPIVTRVFRVGLMVFATRAASKSTGENQ